MTVELRTGSVLGRYELLMPVAKGGMARVWLARLHGSRGFNKLVAVKTILANQEPEMRSEAMLLEEARLAASVHHPNVVTTLDLGEENGLLYLVMEWVHGESLREVYRHALPSGGVPLRLGVNLLAQACKGLHAAHDARNADGTPLHIVHRDISPQNLLISYSGMVKVADFGIAKAKLNAAELTQPGELKGKASFMSPEQLACQPLDRRSDIFAMGTLMYMLTTGHHPFRGASMSKTLRNICECDPPRPSAVHREFPRDLEQVIVKALEKDPDLRWQSAAELFDALVATSEGSLLGHYEAPVAEYMHRLMGARERERLEALGRLLHTGAPPTPPAPSARPIDNVPPAAAGGPQSLGPHVMGSTNEHETEGDERPSNTTMVSQIRHLRQRRWIAALTAIGAIALGVAVGQLNPSGSGVPSRADEDPSLTAASMLDPASVAAIDVVEPDRSARVQASRAGVPTHSANERTGDAIAPPSVTEGAPPSGRAADEEVTLPAALPPAVAGAPKPSPRPPNVQAERNASPGTGGPKSPSPSNNVNAWDRSLFGGRN